jgi:non-heme chloroperoxidase
MPFPEACEECPIAASTEYLDSILDAFRGDRSTFTSVSLPSIFALEQGNQMSKQALEHFERIVAQADLMAIEKTAVILRKSTHKELGQLAAAGKEVPMLILHGKDDSGMPAEASALRIKEIVPWAQVKLYEKAGHGTHDAFQLPCQVTN